MIAIGDKDLLGKLGDLFDAWFKEFVVISAVADNSGD